jgi:Mrp family chromosome partitioning ATPase/capsular polysaccharide biosynthesis protein
MNDTTTDVGSIFAPLWKRKWLILAVAILVAAGTYEYYKRQPGVYTASTKLYLGGASEQQAAVGSAPVKSTLSGRALTDQVELINSSVIGIPVRKRLREEHQLAAARGKVKATPSGSSDFIAIATEARTPKAAATLANAYAQAYIKRQRANYLHNVKTAITNTRDQLRRIEPGPSTSKGKGAKTVTSNSAALQAASLASKINQLEATLSSFSGVQQVSPAKAALLPLSPTPKKNAIFGFFLGLILASVAAYALTRLDRRTRSLGEIEEVFATQVLAALPKVGSPVARPGGKRGPAKSLVEPLRRLQTVLALGDMLDGNREKGPRVILFLSADAGDGRSSLVANLARVQADGGDRVAIVEADFRRPTQAQLLDVSAPNGLSEVLAGKVDHGVAMQGVKLTAREPSGAPDGAEAPGADGGLSATGEPSDTGLVSALLSGGPVANPPALMAGDAMAELLRTLADEFDYVLIDAPPPLEVSDVMPLLHLVDGLIVVARIGHTRDVSAQRLAQLLQRTASAPVLGAVANCVPRKDIERYGFSWVPMEQRRHKLIRR